MRMKNFRFYVETLEGLRRLPQGFVWQEYPHLAGMTRVKTLQVMWEWRGDDLWWSITGDFSDFDNVGKYTLSREHMDAIYSQFGRKTTEELRACPIPNIKAIRDAERRKEEHDARFRWSPTPDQLTAIYYDLMGPVRPKGSKAIPLFKQARKAQ